MRIYLHAILLLAVWPSFIFGAEHVFDFSKVPVGEAPPGFRSTVTGLGKPGRWQIVSEEVAPSIPSITGLSPAVSRRPVLAQTAQDPTDEHFPLLIYEAERFGDFAFTTRFKTVSGEREQMAGVAFRIQDERNYYVIRASSLGNTLRFYKFVNGERSVPIGPDMSIPQGVWHELTVECKGSQIRCLLNGKEVLPALNDSSFSIGQIGFWSKSDSVSYFTEARIRYTPRIPLAQRLIEDGLKRHPRLLGLKVFARSKSKSGPVQVIASSDEKEIGQQGDSVPMDVIDKDHIYQGKSRKVTVVTLPLHDRNGEVIAAVSVLLKPFPGQTEANAIARALPIVKEMEKRTPSWEDLTESNQ